MKTQTIEIDECTLRLLTDINRMRDLGAKMLEVDYDDMEPWQHMATIRARILEERFGMEVAITARRQLGV